MEKDCFRRIAYLIYRRIKGNRKTKKEQEKQNSELYAQIGRLSTQLDWLKKNLAFRLSRHERVALVEWESAALPIATQAKLLSLNRTSPYYQPVPPSAKEIAIEHRID